MPPKKSRNIPQCFVPATDGPDRYVCTSCREYLKGTYEKSMGYASMRGHMESQSHLASQAASEARIACEASMSTRIQADRAVLLSAPPTINTGSHAPSPMSFQIDTLHELAEEGERLALTAEESFAWVNEEIRLASERWGLMDEQCDTMGLFDAAEVAADFGLNCGDDITHEDEESCEDDFGHIGTNIETYGDIVIPREDHTWFPYPNKTMCLLDALDHLPRQRISDRLMKMILWTMKESGSTNVPSLIALRTLQAELRRQSSVQTREFRSVLGNIFYMNDISSIICNDISNPQTRKDFQFYPVESAGSVSEVWHAEKWCKDPRMLDCLTPMIVSPSTGEHIYVDEVAMLADSTYVIPKRWIIRNDVMHADAFLLEKIDEDNFFVRDDALIDVPACNIKMGFTLLEEHRVLPVQIQYGTYTGRCKPNPLRQAANGLPLYTVMIDVWHDDVSGNRSKSYNKHNNTYFSIKNLPRETLQQECHIHFVGTSQYASPLEQAAAVKEMIEATHKVPVVTFDGIEHQKCCFRIFVNAVPADNPMQSELCSHIGGQGNCMCRKCTLGGKSQEKELGEGFRAIFKPGIPRTVSQTAQAVCTQLDTATQGVAQTVKDLQTGTGVKDKIAQVFIERTIDDYRRQKKTSSSTALLDFQRQQLAQLQVNKTSLMNPLLCIPGFDPHCDTPVELLHTVLLGLVKYAWHMSHTDWKADQKALYTQRLQSTDINGMSLPPIRAGYIMQYANSLIGRQFKIIVQTATLHLRDLVTPQVYRLWKAIGSLATLLWFPEIDDLESYLNDLQVCLDNVLDSFALIDPTKILHKVKLHILTHIIEDIRRFGPLLGESTEGFESYNAIFRSCSIMSNHLAPSRDIAQQLAEFEGAKQRFIGGYWRNTMGVWVQSSPSVRLCFMQNKQLQSHFGWVSSEPFIPGTVKVTRDSANKPFAYDAGSTINTGHDNVQSQWSKGTYVICSTGDRAFRGSWIFAKSPLQSGLVFAGQIIDILVSSDTSARSLISIKRYEVSDVLHSRFSMPVLYEPHDESRIINISGDGIIIVVNVQHDCDTAGCGLTGSKFKKMERKVSSIKEKVIQHNALSRYVINLNTFHNAHIIRRILPRHLTIPEHFIHPAVRTQTHDSIATALRTEMTKRRTTTKEKRAAKLSVLAATTATATATVPGDSIAGSSASNSTVIQTDKHASKRKRQ